ncbi:hypothetical protein Taro_041252 [Colocasia esculenta]|uniref:Uncharacterized protein n=1 Tax=Colocasia esculenta TaxID=4460 RepID=A0A843WVB0_COLES|nr:hypothetical protein [Colocasia esculenta]
MAALSRSSGEAEVGARLASRGRGRHVPLLAARGSDLVAVVVTTFPSVIRCPCLHSGCSLAVSSFRGHYWSGLVWTRAFGVSALVIYRFRSLVLGCQSMVAPACVVSRPRSVSGVRGDSACGPSTLWRCAEGCFHLVPNSVGFCESRVYVTTLVGGRDIALSCCSGRRGTGNPYWALFARLTPYFLQLGARHRGSSMPDGLRWQLWRRVLLAAVRVSVVSSCT